MWTKQTHVNELTFQERSRLRGTEISTTLFGFRFSVFSPTYYIYHANFALLSQEIANKEPADLKHPIPELYFVLFSTS